MEPAEVMTDGATVVVVKFGDCVGAARCHPDDEFDYDIGRALAQSRAMEKRAILLQARAKTLRRDAYSRVNSK